ncbi:MAG: RidA family protein [Candidatus Aminicenantes bacterium]|nr:RidA family protein [Candidatus Aminicenantes bacterium]
MEFVFTNKAPAPAGHYSQAVVHNGLVYVSGQLPLVPGGGDPPRGIEAQTLQVLVNLEAVLTGAGSSLDQVLKVTVYVSDMALWERVNDVYARFFGDHRPARAVVPTRELHYGFLLEIDAVAVVSQVGAVAAGSPHSV